MGALNERPDHTMNTFVRLASCGALAALAGSLAGCCSTSSTAKRPTSADSGGGAITIIRGGEASLDRGVPALPPPDLAPASRGLPPPLDPPVVVRHAPAVAPLPVVRTLPAAAPDFATPLARPSGLTPLAPAPATDAPLGDPARLLFGMVPDEAALAAHKVYFAYDASAISAKELAKVRQVAAHLKSAPATRLVVDGHCDERGTEEYNRALGERRALSIRSQLLREGVSPDRVFTRTFGKDRPAVPGHAEQSWWQNRRGEFVLLRPRPR